LPTNDSSPHSFASIGGGGRSDAIICASTINNGANGSNVADAFGCVSPPPRMMASSASASPAGSSALPGNQGSKVADLHGGAINFTNRADGFATRRRAHIEREKNRLQQQQHQLQEPSKSHPFARSGSGESSRSAASSAMGSTGNGFGRVRQGGRTPHSNMHPPPATAAVSAVVGASHRSGLRSILTKNSDEGGAKSKDPGAGANGKQSVKFSAKTDSTTVERYIQKETNGFAAKAAERYSPPQTILEMNMLCHRVLLLCRCSILVCHATMLPVYYLVLF